MLSLLRRSEVYRSRTEPLTWLDRACGLLLFQLVRCHQCELRQYRPVFFPVPECLYPIRRAANSVLADANGEERERSA
jgi:hypothetical protein